MRLFSLCLIPVCTQSSLKSAYSALFLAFNIYSKPMCRAISINLIRILDSSHTDLCLINTVLIYSYECNFISMILYLVDTFRGFDSRHFAKINIVNFISSTYAYVFLHLISFHLFLLVVCINVAYTASFLRCIQSSHIPYVFPVIISFRIVRCLFRLHSSVVPAFS